MSEPTSQPQNSLFFDDSILSERGQTNFPVHSTPIQRQQPLPSLPKLVSKLKMDRITPIESDVFGGDSQQIAGVQSIPSTPIKTFDKPAPSLLSPISLVPEDNFFDQTVATETDVERSLITEVGDRPAEFFRPDNRTDVFPQTDMTPPWTKPRRQTNYGVEELTRDSWGNSTRDLSRNLVRDLTRDDDHDEEGYTRNGDDTFQGADTYDQIRQTCDQDRFGQAYGFDCHRGDNRDYHQHDQAHLQHAINHLDLGTPTNAHVQDQNQDQDHDHDDDDDNPFEIGHLLKLGQDGRPISPAQGLGTIPHSWNRYTAYLNETLKRDEKWIRLPEGKCCKDCAELAERNWLPKKLNSKWYPMPGCMAKVPIDFDPATHETPYVAKGCGQCRIRNAGMTCSLAFRKPTTTVLSKAVTTASAYNCTIGSGAYRTVTNVGGSAAGTNGSAPKRTGHLRSASMQSSRSSSSSGMIVPLPASSVRAGSYRTATGSSVGSSRSIVSSTTTTVSTTSSFSIDVLRPTVKSACRSYVEHRDEPTYETCRQLWALLANVSEVDDECWKALKRCIEHGKNRGL